jgi:hypothetical protein
MTVRAKGILRAVEDKRIDLLAHEELLRLTKSY